MRSLSLFGKVNHILERSLVLVRHFACVYDCLGKGGIEFAVSVNQVWVNTEDGGIDVLAFAPSEQTGLLCPVLISMSASPA